MLSSPSILPPNIRRSIRSLELVIDTQSSPLKYAFEDQEFSSPALHAAPIFPSLLYLRISPVDWDIDISVRRDQLLNQLHHYTTFNPENSITDRRSDGGLGSHRLPYIEQCPQRMPGPSITANARMRIWREKILATNPDFYSQRPC